MKRKEAEKLAIELGRFNFERGDDGFCGENVPHESAVKLLMGYVFAPPNCPACEKQTTSQYACTNNSCTQSNSDREAPAQPPCSECATPSDKWSPVIAEAFKVQKVNMNCFKLYFFGSFLGAHHSQKSAENRAGMLSYLILKWTNKYANLLTDELVNAKTECATLRKERDDYRHKWNDVLIHEDAALKSCRSLTAQLSTLRDALRSIEGLALSCIDTHETTCANMGAIQGIAEAALAPTPEVAPKEEK